MNTFSKLALLCALALAAMAVASASALATTATPEGAWTATEDGPGSFSNGLINLVCQQSDLAGTVQNTGAGTAGSGGANTTAATGSVATATVETLTLTECSNGLNQCTFTVDTLPFQLNIVHPSTNAGRTADLTNVNNESLTMTCAGGLNCAISVDTTLELQLTNGTHSSGGPQPTIRVVNQSWTMTPPLTCGATGTLNVAWTIITTAGATDTTFEVSA
jgi:hypothetical protein